MKTKLLLPALVLLVSLVAANFWFEARNLEHSRDAWRAYADFVGGAAVSRCVTREQFILLAQKNGWEIENDGVLLSTPKPKDAASHLIVMMEPRLPFLETGSKERGEVLFFDQRDCWMNPR